MTPCDCGRSSYDPTRHTSCYDCFLDRRADYVTCIGCGVRWHAPHWALCYRCRYIDGRAAAPDREEAARSLRLDILIRDDFSCRICGDSDGLQVDHVRPCRVGGTADPWNLQVLCGPCNRDKGGEWPGRRGEWAEMRRSIVADYFLDLRGYLTDEQTAALRREVSAYRRQPHPPWNAAAVIAVIARRQHTLERMEAMIESGEAR